MSEGRPHLYAGGPLAQSSGTRDFDKVGGRDRFVDSALGSTGAQGRDPAAVPLYSMAYALYA
ncbi:hypothetical protein [Streptomyces sp. UG1]|uniref:hypothetical protein n=1 Tax=Streptomyces sp. UG1 TaxID=3417652 RepID=UPI003CE837C9